MIEPRAAARRPASRSGGRRRSAPCRPTSSSAGSSGLNACAATPPNSARACGASEGAGEQRRRQRRRQPEAERAAAGGGAGAGRAAGGPRRATSNAGRRARRTARRHARPSSPSPAAVVRRSSAASRRRCRRRADARGRPRASATRARGARGRASSRNGEPTAIGCTAEQSSCSTPGHGQLAVRVPPPIVGLGLEHGHARPRARRARPRTRARSGPTPTTMASLTRAGGRRARAPARRPRPGSPTSSSSQGPRATMSAHVDPALLDQARRGVVDPVVLALDVGRLRLEHDHAQLARREAAPLLDRLEQLLVVEVAVAEVPAGDDAGDQLALAHVVVLDVVDRARQQPVERAAVAVHRAEREPLVEQQLGRLAVVEPASAARRRSARPCRCRGRASPRRRSSLRNSHWLVAQLPA